MGRFINSEDTVIDDLLEGLALAHPDLVDVDVAHRIVRRATPKAPGRVALVSGGGTGHEPLHSGFVGQGMLDAAVIGDVFTSPTPDLVSRALTQVTGDAGALVVVKNYTGDVLNFDMGVELAADAGLRTRTVLVADDVAVNDTGIEVGRRGVGATVLVERTAGAAAEQGRDLDDVADLAQRVASRARSFGVGMRPGTALTTGRPVFDLPEGQMEIGVGIHGELGVRRGPSGTAKEVAGVIVSTLLDCLDRELGGRRAWADGGLIVLLSGLGATPRLELYVLYAEIARLLNTADVWVHRRLVGEYVTSLDMAGCTLTVLPADEELLELWDAPVVTSALRWGA